MYLRAWDRHIAGCRECLSYGLHLCAEGEFLTFDVERARTRIDEVVAQLNRTRSHPAALSLDLSVPRSPSPSPSSRAGVAP